jgi:hypothetical protein
LQTSLWDRNDLCPIIDNKINKHNRTCVIESAINLDQTLKFLINKTNNQHRTNEGERGATETKAKFDETKLSDDGGED